MVSVTLAFACLGFIVGIGANWCAERYVRKRIDNAGKPRVLSLYGAVLGAAGALAFGSIGSRLGLQLAGGQLVLLCADLLFLSRVDLLSRIIPNGCIIFALAVRAIYLALVFPFAPDASEVLLRSLAGLLILGGITALLGYIIARRTGRSALGGGDVKLFAVMGFYFGVRLGLFVAAIACVLALIGCALMKRGRLASFAFGPAISLACILMLALAALG